MSQKQIITLHISREKFVQTLTFLPMLLMIAFAFTFVSGNTGTADRPALPYDTDITPILTTPERREYPARGSQLNTNLFAKELPPPPLDALPYEIREPLSNGVSVPVKKRWVWLPDGMAITITKVADGHSVVEVPLGALWWKEFYIETDRGVFLIERRIIERVRVSKRYPEGWAFYTSHAPTDPEATNPIILSSTSGAAAEFMFNATDWLPTQATTNAVEVQFKDMRGLAYNYVFPGQVQCAVCHAGAAGAYPNLGENPIQVFGLHPNNLTPDSYKALVRKGWIVGADDLLTPGYPDESDSGESPSFDSLTDELVGVMRNNCASCHNAAPGAAASFTSFILDPNRDYSSQELLTLLSADSRMMGDAGFPLVTPGSLDTSEIWLRINGLDGRRRMPPMEGGLPEPDPHLVELLYRWILAAHEQP